MKEVLIKGKSQVRNSKLRHPIFTEKAFLDMTLRKIPDFESLYEDLNEGNVFEEPKLNALHFLPALREFSLNEKEINQILKNPEPKHVLIENELLKVVLIRWAPGDISGIHGHAKGGCVLKIFHGEIVEKRYSTDDRSMLLSESKYYKDNITYIDDIMALHDVANISKTHTISLHMYTPGKKS